MSLSEHGIANLLIKIAAKIIMEMFACAPLTGHSLDTHWTDTHWTLTGHPLDTHWTLTHMDTKILLKSLSTSRKIQQKHAGNQMQLLKNELP